MLLLSRKVQVASHSCEIVARAATQPDELHQIETTPNMCVNMWNSALEFLLEGGTLKVKCLVIG